MNVLIVDDHAVVREGLARILTRLPEDVQVGEAGSVYEGLTLLRAQRWDIVLLDIAMPGKSGLELLRQIAREHDAPPVLVLSSFPEDQYAVRLLRSGARGYLNKEAAPDQLLAAVQTVMSGQRYVSNRLAADLASSVVAGPGGEYPRHEALSDREFQVLRLLAAGRTVTEIGREVSLSVKTVSTYRVRLLDKLGLRNTAELIAYALKNGIV